MSPYEQGIADATGILASGNSDAATSEVEPLRLLTSSVVRDELPYANLAVLAALEAFCEEDE